MHVFCKLRTKKHKQNLSEWNRVSNVSGFVKYLEFKMAISTSDLVVKNMQVKVMTNGDCLNHLPRLHPVSCQTD